LAERAAGELTGDAHTAERHTAATAAAAAAAAAAAEDMSRAGAMSGRKQDSE
jgi:hypothetical protein